MYEERDRSKAFDALSDPIRVAIVEALVAARRETPDDPERSFSELRDRVGVEDSGRFNYHLGKLRGRFVEQTDDGYELNYAGEQVASAILAGTLDESETRDPVALDHDCPICDAPMAARFDAGRVTASCDEGHELYRTNVPPAAATGRTVEELLAFSVDLTHSRVLLNTRGICPECYGHVESEVRYQEANGVSFHAMYWTCRLCGRQSQASLGICLLQHPDLATFYRDHGIDVDETYPWLLPVIQTPAEQVGEDPARYRLEIQEDGETFRATLDGDGAVVETERFDTSD
ncbi:winged helix-turn-helix domain-containing protein [Haloarchaeobius sp. HME9146]|uniref:winged helix-turn-helix domain-containing protein n=1 Tax=Haloarchaeobius sp. HME9146 TaxID=2978732 RepID=UPI0021BEE696|nr:winged helix-turn-helix domain-containing protein [Haloarchaeobius sp. HME9146]